MSDFKTFIAYTHPDKQKDIKEWLNERFGESGPDTWTVDLFVDPFKIFMIEFANERHQSLFELRFAGEIEFITSVEAMRRCLSGLHT